MLVRSGRRDERGRRNGMTREMKRARATVGKAIPRNRRANRDGNSSAASVQRPPQESYAVQIILLDPTGYLWSLRIALALVPHVGRFGCNHYHTLSISEARPQLACGSNVSDDPLHGVRFSKFLRLDFGSERHRSNTQLVAA